MRADNSVFLRTLNSSVQAIKLIFCIDILTSSYCSSVEIVKLRLSFNLELSVLC